ncbi:MAG: aquaporin family protein [Acidobacteriota bacterium]|nr:aquaporin family protein [Acidobacteriota bacterium]
MSDNKYRPNLLKRATAEFLGTAFLLAVVVGSGIMGERLANGNTAIALLANSLATGAGLIFLILTFAPISGAHFNPAVTLAGFLQKNTSLSETLVYSLAQICGAFAGTAMANAMFELPLFFASNKIRNGSPLIFSEFTATFGLLAVILSVVKFRVSVAPFAVAAYITSAYWFTASTSFANPAVTLARTLTDTFTGIRAADAPPFIIAQFAGAIAAVFLFRWLLKEER